MSIELPEAKILAEQMNTELQGKRVKTYRLKDYERMQKIGFMNKDVKTFDQLINKMVESVISRGNTILVKLNNDVNLILNPEYGGKILYHSNGENIREKFHLRVDFKDQTALTARITSMGGIFVIHTTDLMNSYAYKRDFNLEVLSPTDETFTLEQFSKLLAENNRMLKSVLVGKDAVIVGVSNSAFQDIIYRAKLHPKRKASSLDETENLNLFNAIKNVTEERIRLNGKEEFLDLYGNKGSYRPTMGSNMKGQKCLKCGNSIEKLSIGGGSVYVCPKCQR